MNSPQGKVWAIAYFQVLIILSGREEEKLNCNLCELAGGHYLSAQVTIEEDVIL